MVQDHALAKHFDKRLIELHQSQVSHDLGPEARIQQVKHGMLNATDVLVHRHPVIIAGIDHGLVVAWRGISHEVPG